MRIVKKDITLLLPVLLIMGCSDNFSNVTTNGYPLSVSSVSLNGVQTRSTTSLATEGSTISVSTLNSGVVSATSQYTYTSGAWGVASGCSPLVTPEGTNLCAYYPYSKDITDKSSIPLSSVKYDASKDLSYAYSIAIADVAHSISHATFSLQHAYAQLTFRFSCSSSYTGSKSIGDIIISNSGILRSAGLDITKSGGAYGSKVAGDVSFNADITDFTITPSASVLAVPTDVLSDNLSILIQIGSDYKLLTLPASLFANGKLEAGVNYQISVNVNSTLTLKSADIETIDWVIPSSVTNLMINIQPESNSYIVAPGGTIYIPVSRASTGNAANFPVDSPFTCGLLWSDVSATHVTTSIVDRFIKLTAGSDEGNSVVYAKNKNGDIVWSWHIWVTGYNPSTTHVTYNGKVWMDRNLGAKTNGTSSTAYGLSYQWGRKDPFPGSIDGSTMSTTYGNLLPTLVAGPVSLVTAIQNPNIFYKCNNGINDWQTPQSDALWNNSGKTVYDPCPDGWRVPLDTEFSGTFPDNTPAGGWSWRSNGSVYYSIGFGYWWSSVYSTYAFYLSNSGSVNGCGSVAGNSVRCIKN